MASEIAQGMLEKDKGLYLSAEECERNFKLAKEAALADVCSSSRGCPKKVHSTPSVLVQPVNDHKVNDCRDLDGGVSTNGRKRKLSRKMADALQLDHPSKKKTFPTTSAGNYQVLIYYQGTQRYIGTFQTLEQATTANDIARGMLEKDKGLRLSSEECERNVKLAKEAALADVPDQPWTSGLSNPQGVTDKANGSWQVRVWYQSSLQYIGTFKSLESAILANEIAWSMLDKDKELQLSAEDCERNFKLAKEAALTIAMPDRQKKSPEGVYETPSGKWRVQIYYQGSHRGIGTFQTLEQATLANEIARSMFKKSTSSVLLNEQEIEAIKRAAVKGVSEMNMEKERITLSK